MAAMSKLGGVNGGGNEKGRKVDGTAPDSSRDMFGSVAEPTMDTVVFVDGAIEVELTSVD